MATRRRKGDPVQEGGGTVITLPNDWRPRAYQRPLWSYLEGGGRRGVAIWHRRAGKDDLCLHWTAVSAFQRVGSYWHMLPEAKQARKAIWDAVNPSTGQRRIDTAFPAVVRAATRDTDMFIRFKNGSTWQAVGSDNFNSLVGAPPVGIVFSEWALANPAAWGYLRPILEENGGWALFITTSRGDNHAKQQYDMALREPDWFAQVLPATDTDVFEAGQLERIRREMIGEYGTTVGDALFQQEYLCSFQAAIIGSYYGEQLQQAENEGRLTRVPHDPGVQVHTAWDLGISDHTVIWFYQTAGREVHLIDYHAANGKPLEYFARVLQEKPYLYGHHTLPHDVQVRELGTGRSRLETLAALGIQVRIVPNLPVEDGINAARRILPRCWIDRERCAEGLRALQNYRTEWDDKHKVFQAQPLHDWASHGADAFRYLALSLEEQKVPRDKKKSAGAHLGAGGWMG